MKFNDTPTVGIAEGGGEALDPARLLRAKPAYTTRHVHGLIQQDPCKYSVARRADVAPRAGDVVLARVGVIGQHPRIELSGGRRALLFPGDEVLVAYGPRYAPDQFEAEVPADLGPTHLVAAGGVAGSVLSAHSWMLPPTTLDPVGLLTDADGVVTLKRCAPHHTATDQAARPSRAVPTVAVLGTSMNSGKTTTVASVVRGLTAAGLSVAAGKVTGTGAGGDPGLFADGGASAVLDFTDFGHPSTYLLAHEEVLALLTGVHRELAAREPDVIVLEVADGLLQRETRRLVADPLFRSLVDRVVFAAGEAMGAAAGLATLAGLGLDVVAVSGMVTASPLATREARAILDVPVLTQEELSDPQLASSVMALFGGSQATAANVDERVAV